MNSTLKMLVKDVYTDLKPSYPTLTLDWLLDEADKQVAGNQPMGAVGVFLNRYLKQIGTIS